MSITSHHRHQNFLFSLSYTDMFMNIEELEVPPILTTKNDDIIWNIFPDFGNKKEEATEEVENIEE